MTIIRTLYFAITVGLGYCAFQNNGFCTGENTESTGQKISDVTKDAGGDKAESPPTPWALKETRKMRPSTPLSHGRIGGAGKTSPLHGATLGHNEAHGLKTSPAAARSTSSTKSTKKASKAASSKKSSSSDKRGKRKKAPSKKKITAKETPLGAVNNSEEESDSPAASSTPSPEPVIKELEPLMTAPNIYNWGIGNWVELDEVTEEELNHLQLISPQALSQAPRTLSLYPIIADVKASF